MHRHLALAGLILVAACAEDLDSEALIGTWEMQEITGELCTLVPGGELEVAPDLTGTVDWTIDCAMGGMFSEIGTFDDVSVERTDIEYSFTLTSGTQLFDWECIIDEPEMDCTETNGMGTVLIFKFRREP